MSSTQILRVTFVISLLSHGAILSQSPNLNPFTPAPKEQKIEVRYIKEKLETKSLLRDSSKSRARSSSEYPVESGSERMPSKSNPFLNLDAKVIAGGRIPPPYVAREDAFKGTGILSNRSVDFPKPAFVSSDLTVIKKKITLPEIKMAKIENPIYISYYQIVREKIRRSAYQNYISNEKGEVYISFIIANDGLLKDVHLAEERSSANLYLKDTALRSIQDASPFPSFPKELDYPQLSFNIIISFEIE